MTIQATTPYLNLSGNTERAIEFYRSSLRADVETLVRFGDMDDSCSARERHRVMYATLRVGNARLIAGDGPEDCAAARGGVVSVALELDDPDEMRRMFAALAASGTVTEAIVHAPLGTLFGSVIDPFGVCWMLNCSKRKL